MLARMETTSFPAIFDVVEQKWEKRETTGLALILRQCPHEQGLVVSCAASRGDDGDILFAVFSLIGHRNRVDVIVQADGPELLARLRIRCAETTIARGADEDETAGSDHRSTKTGRADVLLPFRHVVIHTERDAPHELSRRGIHGHQAGPGRTVAGKVAHRAAIRVASLRSDRSAADLRVRKLRVLRAFVIAWVWLNPSGGRLVFRVHENVSELRI